MCGIAGVFHGCGADQAVALLVEAAVYLQHRGQDACGIATATDDGQSYRFKDLGLVSDVFQNPQNVQGLAGHMGVLHLRYPTAGSKGSEHLQPLYSNIGARIFLAHRWCTMRTSSNEEIVLQNGNLLNCSESREQLLDTDIPTPKHGVDSQIILDVLSQEMQQVYRRNPNEFAISAIVAALKVVYARCRGSFACIALVDESVLVGFRDAYGLKPLVYGRRLNPDGSVAYMFSSESVALEALGFHDIRDVKPGEAVFVSKDPAMRVPRIFHWQVSPMISYSPDIFEFVYLARPESMIDGISVHRSRYNMGEALAETVRESLSTAEVDAIDVVIPIPETSYTGAYALASALRKPYAHGFVKNVYSTRTFIMPEQKLREKAVRRKLNPINDEFLGKVVLLVDDSIVRGTTSKEIVRMARAAGAKKIICASCSPPIRFDHVYGVDLAERRQLVAHGRTNLEICSQLGCDDLIYLPIDRLIAACLKARKTPLVECFEVGVFTGTYITGGHEEYLRKTTRNRRAGKKEPLGLVQLSSSSSSSIEAVECFPRLFTTR
ncbi:amidophosphoribosyltransferase [Phlyctema vagabunda]|uniref:Amidophosphoribosyltransferase n=1 Tax=Phlyctema vagabunda TaxID=108571 RepID=A0ABR4PUW3_9HELO